MDRFRTNRPERIHLAASADSGPRDARVTMVLFSDFQCSFCRRFADFLSALSPREIQQTRLIFKQRPLLMHNWARRAALATICASFQGNEFFWPLHDFLFSSQSSLTATTLDTAVGQFMEQNARFRLDDYHRCMEEHTAEPVLQRDEALAETYHVDATPTIFINGVRKMGFGSPEQLRVAINSAIATAQKGRVDREK